MDNVKEYWAKGGCGSGGYGSGSGDGDGSSSGSAYGYGLGWGSGVESIGWLFSNNVGWGNTRFGESQIYGRGGEG